MSISIFTVKQITESVKNIREQVFIREQQVPVDLEWDADDRRAIHYCLAVDDKVVAIARTVAMGKNLRLGRMAVVKPCRRLGYGSRLLDTVICDARRKNYQQIIIHAQCYIVEFYEKHGFRAVEPPFDEAGICHQKMYLNL